MDIVIINLYMVMTSLSVVLMMVMVMAAAMAHAETTSLDMADTSDWAFVGPKWSQKAAAAAAAETPGAGWIMAPGSPRAREGNVAVYTEAAFAAPCNITLSFIQVLILVAINTRVSCRSNG